ncbi:uncharacterized protein LOC131437033 [Malaya genurostris]|uniref:uncharacterized protein LOC131437033 n=1 Tax=Malaya genurostris TaxID=325434 RepID=UPI0026F3ACA6|nr:uncharacterized protein LOC131437033 [Malaya genurostris]
MGKKTRLASFCRLCLTKTKNKVEIFGEERTVENLLQLIEIQVDENLEPGAVVCFDCIVTLEGFYQFKEQCHVNDDFVKNIPPEEETSNFDDELEEEDDSNRRDVEDDDDEVDEPVETIEEEEVFTQEMVSPKAKRKCESPKNSPKSKTIRRHIKPIDPEKVEKECAALNISRRAMSGPTLDDLLVLADSYPDFFYFEKGPRSIYFTLVFYGERYHSALFTERYTYWQCKHRIKYRCPAQVCVTNDYKSFERRCEHTHGDLPFKEGKIYTPLQALPELFEACRKVVLRGRAKRLQKLLDKHKQKQAQQLSDDGEDEEQEDAPDPLIRVMRKSDVEDDDRDYTDDDDEDDYIKEESDDDD